MRLHSLVQIPNIKFPNFPHVVFALFHGKGRAELTDNCFSKASENEGRTAVEYNIMKLNRNLNDKIEF